MNKDTNSTMEERFEKDFCNNGILPIDSMFKTDKLLFTYAIKEFIKQEQANLIREILGKMRLLHLQKGKSTNEVDEFVFVEDIKHIAIEWGIEV